MIELDTNVLARYYIQDESDAEATKQHESARRLIEFGKPLMVSKTVLSASQRLIQSGFRGCTASGQLRQMQCARLVR